jgi:DNA-binding NarL/FixJ family response regulator
VVEIIKMDKLRIILAEDHITVREGIKMLIDSQTNMEVIGEAGNGEEAIILVQELDPDVIVMDISMPGLNGLKATKKIKRICPEAKILTLTRHKDDSYLQQLIQAGVSGYVLKQSASSELIHAIQHIAKGNNYIDPALTKKVFGGYVGQHIPLQGEGTSEPTPREEEILRYVAMGYSNKEIAARLELSVKTIETHKANAMRKMNMRSRIDIVRYAILQGWLEEN